MRRKTKGKKNADKTYSILYNNLVTDPSERNVPISRQTTLSNTGGIVTHEQKEEAISKQYQEILTKKQ